MIRPMTGLLFFAMTSIGLVAAPAQAKDPKVYTSTFSNLAVSGYDPVAYFTDGKPVKGDKKFSHTWMDVEWRFASAEHRALFVASPEKFAPQFGGHCAWAVSQGYTASADPEAWRIVDGKLYLNYDANVQKRWENDIQALITKGNELWPGMIQE